MPCNELFWSFYTFNSLQKEGVSVLFFIYIFYVFAFSFSLRLHLFDQKYSKISKIVKYYNLK